MRQRREYFGVFSIYSKMAHARAAWATLKADNPEAYRQHKIGLTGLATRAEAEAKLASLPDTVRAFSEVSEHSYL